MLANEYDLKVRCFRFREDYRKRAKAGIILSLSQYWIIIIMSLIRREFYG